MSTSMETGLDSLHFVSDVLAGVDDEDKSNITRFALFLEEWVRNHGLNERYNIFQLLDTFGVYDLSTLNKEGSCLQALWVIFLRIMRKNLDDDSIFKYKSMNEFLSAYRGDFDKIDTSEQVKLFHTANWMTILFKMVPAKKNKGLSVHVIPKLVEGFSVKYITGSGQTKATSDRVRIFEHEGNVKPFQRGKWKNNEELRKLDIMPFDPMVVKKSKKDKTLAASSAIFDGGLELPAGKKVKGLPGVGLERFESFDPRDILPIDTFGREKSIDSVDFAECLKLLRTNSTSITKPSDLLATETSPPAAAADQRQKPTEAVDFAECLKLLRSNSYSMKPPELSRDWSNSSLGFLTDSLLQPLGNDGFFDRSTDGANDGLSLLNEAANASSILPMSSMDYAILGNDDKGSFDLSHYNHLASAPVPLQRRFSGGWRQGAAVPAPADPSALLHDERMGKPL